MSFIEIGEAYIPTPPFDEVGSICWRAREILGAYMLEGTDIETNIEVSTVELHDESSETDYDDDEDFGPILHETHAVQVNDNQNVNFSNRPCLLAADGSLFQYTMPGYVVLHVEPVDFAPTDFTPDPAVCDQLVFRLPHSGTHEGGAIFHGFSLDESCRIDTDSKEVEAVGRLLEHLRLAFYNLMTEQPEYYEGTYLSQTPEESIDAQLLNSSDLNKPW